MSLLCLLCGLAALLVALALGRVAWVLMRSLDALGEEE